MIGVLRGAWSPQRWRVGARDAVRAASSPRDGRLVVAGLFIFVIAAPLALGVNMLPAVKWLNTVVDGRTGELQGVGWHLFRDGLAWLAIPVVLVLAAAMVFDAMRKMPTVVCYSRPTCSP